MHRRLRRERWPPRRRPEETRGARDATREIVSPVSAASENLSLIECECCARSCAERVSRDGGEKFGYLFCALKKIEMNRG